MVGTALASLFKSKELPQIGQLVGEKRVLLLLESRKFSAVAAKAALMRFL